MGILSLIGGKLKLYFFAIVAFGVSVFIFIFKARGRKIKKQKKIITGHESNKRITEGDKKREVKRRTKAKETKGATADELVEKANSRNRK